jgi:perosamine synthetase
MNSKNNKIVAIIQARSGSSRMRNKILTPLHAGMSMLEHIIARVERSKYVDQVVVATTTNEEDDIVAETFREKGVKVYRGSVDDVLSRMYNAAVALEADIVVRITADDPFKDPDVIDEIIDRLLVEKVDYASNTLECTYPEGIDVEVVTMEALSRAHHEATLPSEREHVTPYIWKNADRFKLLNHRYGKDLSDIRLTVDYPEDFEMAQRIYAVLYPSNPEFGMMDIIRLLGAEPEIFDNIKRIRNEGYMKSVSKELQVVQRIGDKERQYVEEVLSSQFRSSAGATFMTKLEKAFADKYGVKYAISSVNGTATMHAALEAKGIGEGDEVIVPPLTMASTSLCVLQANATPVFADVDPDTWVIDPVSIEKCITSKTKAIVTVALYGLAPDMEKIMEIADKHDLFVIEDNAEAFLAYQKDRLVGTWGHCASFSFQSSKHLSAGEGGMVITDDDELALAIRKAGGLGYSSLGLKKARIAKEDIQHPSFARHDYMGWNYRMPELCCAVALAQVERMDELVDVRVQAAKALDAVVREFPDILTPQKVDDDMVSSFWTYVCKLNTDLISWEDFRALYTKYDGDAYYGAWQLTYHEPLFQQKKFGRRTKYVERDYPIGICPVAESLQPKLVQFKTNYWNLNEVNIQAGILRKVLEEVHQKSD